MELPIYGTGDATYLAAGELDGITRLVNRFYELMDGLPEAKTLRDMHAKDLTESRKRLVYFLSGWMGGPKLYAQHFGAVTLPVAHAHLPINAATTHEWLHCMEQALIDLDYPDSFRKYLLEKLASPAESIRLMAEYRRNNPLPTENVP